MEEGEKKTYAQLQIGGFLHFHAFLGRHGVVAREHLDEGVSLLGVDDTRLDHAKSGEDGLEVFLGRSIVPLSVVVGRDQRPMGTLT